MLSSDHDRHVINAAMKTLKAIFPAWRNGIRTQEDYDSYAEQLAAAFVDNKIDSLIKLQIGFKRARSQTGRESAFLPNPGVFAGWCKTHVAPYHREFDEPNAAERKQIEQQVSSQSVRDAAIAGMRAMLAEAR